jgi:hypothetical protein
MGDSNARTPTLPRPLKVPSRLALVRLDPLEALETELPILEEPTTRNLKQPLFDTEPCVNLWQDEDQTPPLERLRSSSLGGDTRVSSDPMGTAATVRVKVDIPVELLREDVCEDVCLESKTTVWDTGPSRSASGLSFQMTTSLPEIPPHLSEEDDITVRRDSQRYEDSKVVPLPSLELKTITVQDFEATRRWLWICSVVILLLLIAGGWAAYVLCTGSAMGT